MLNATLCATTRVICCILENNQTPEVLLLLRPSRRKLNLTCVGLKGILVPEVLLPYLNPSFVKVDSQGRKHIPYTQKVFSILSDIFRRNTVISQVKINYNKLKAEAGVEKKASKKQSGSENVKASKKSKTEKKG